jgi:hypothetical protein
MKKSAVLIAVAAAVVSASAPLSTASAQNHQWSVGARVGTGFEAVGQYHFSDRNYLEARFGMDYIIGLNADFSLLHNWRIAIPSRTEGLWFFDAGVGLRLGGAEHLARIGLQGVAKLGYTFEDVPLTLAFDFSPSFGPAIHYHGHHDWDDDHDHYYDHDLDSHHHSHAGFDEWAVCSFALSFVYNF